MAVGPALDGAHRRASHASGILVSQIARKRFSRRETARAVRMLQEAIKILQPLIGEAPEE